MVENDNPAIHLHLLMNAVEAAVTGAIETIPYIFLDIYILHMYIKLS